MKNKLYRSIAISVAGLMMFSSLSGIRVHAVALDSEEPETTVEASEATTEETELPEIIETTEPSTIPVMTTVDVPPEDSIPENGGEDNSPEDPQENMPEEQSLPPMSYHDVDITISSIEELESTEPQRGVNRLTATSLPSSYQTTAITSVKNQNPYGTCWAHATIAAAESNLIKDGTATTDIDLSEWQLAYFMYHPANDELGGLAGDSYTNVESYDNYLDTGGNAQFAVFNLACWKGVTEESKAPYTTVKNNSSATLDSSLAFDDAAHLQNSYWISLRDKDLVKSAIMNYGAAAVSYCDANAYYNQSIWYCSTPLAFYCPTSTQSNHAVTLVGWDDTFSRENFGTYKPTNDGAWLIKNSWGTNYGNDGYFWISYEDAVLLSGNACFMDMEPADNYDHNYQYDGSIVYYYTTSATAEANVYTASSNQTLEAVGFYTADALYNYTVKIYKNVGDSGPIGTLVATQTGSETYAGFHTVSLNSPVTLNRGDKFSVVISQTTQTGGTPQIWYDRSSSSYWYTGVSSAQAGQSYLCYGSGWNDIGSSYQGNCRIKAYTKDRTSNDPVVEVTSITLNKSSATLNINDTCQLSATVLPSNATNKNVTWTSSNTSVASISSSGVVTAKNAGTATITCTACDGSGKYATCTIQVNAKQYVTKITLTPNSLTMNEGETATISAGITPSNATNKTVTWTSSNTGVASVSSSGVVTAKAGGSATITCTAQDGSGKYATCTVQVNAKQYVTKITLSPSSLSMTVGGKATISAGITPSNAINKTVKWTSSNTSVASVSSSGVVTAKAGGSATITCTAQDGSGKYATCQVQVKQLVTKVSLNAQTMTLTQGYTDTIMATLTPSNATDQSVIWSSSNSNVASVSGIWYTPYATITAVAPGSAQITCKAADGSGKYATCTVIVVSSSGSGSSSSSSSYSSWSSSSSSSSSYSSYSSSSYSSYSSSSSSSSTYYTNYSQTQRFVIRLYEKCLGRQADAAGLEHWNSVLVNRERSGAQVAYGFVFSKEYQQQNTSDADYVEMLYQVFMDRSSDENGKQHWEEILAQGVSREYVFRGFAQSKEYTTICNNYGIDRGTFTTTQARDRNASVTGYVNRMYTQALGRTGEEGGLNHWCNIIYSKTKTPEQVAESFIYSAEFKSKNLNNEEYIKVLYRTFMGREADAAGLEHWLGELSRGCSREEILHRFAASKEFRAIQAQFGL